jgi:Response regulator receiver domain
VVRHSHATQVDITVKAGASVAVAEVSDNGAAAAGRADTGASGQPHADRIRSGPLPATSRPAGSRLAGLADRVRDLGGEIVAENMPPRGFRLRVVVPIDGSRHDGGVSMRIMIAEDQTMVRQALVALLELEPDIEVVAQAADGCEAIAMCQKFQPDIAVLDIEMPGPMGLRSPANCGRLACQARW